MLSPHIPSVWPAEEWHHLFYLIPMTHDPESGIIFFSSVPELYQILVITCMVPPSVLTGAIICNQKLVPDSVIMLQKTYASYPRTAGGCARWWDGTGRLPKGRHFCSFIIFSAFNFLYVVALLISMLLLRSSFRFNLGLTPHPQSEHSSCMDLEPVFAVHRCHLGPFIKTCPIQFQSRHNSRTGHC